MQLYKRSSWSFNQEVTNQFEDHVRKSLSFYERIQEMIVMISDYYVMHYGTIYDLGCSTGETIRRLQKQHGHKTVNFIGLDSSPSMIHKATALSKPLNNVEWLCGDLEEFDFPHKSPLILSVLTLHFIPIYKRKAILQKIYDALNEGGCFILVEKTISDHSGIQHIWSHLHYEEKLQEGLSHMEVLDKEKSLRGVLNPLTIKENTRLLEEVGFQTDIFFKEWNFTGFIAVKPVIKSPSY